MQFGVVPTYRCNMTCKWCNRYEGVIPWDDSDLSIGAVEEVGAILHKHKIQPDRIRLTGGEPSMHPNLSGIVEAIERTWPEPKLLTHSFTNGTMNQIGIPIRFRVSDHSDHKPWAISPADLGMSAMLGFDDRECTAKACGKLFDCYGFSFCVHAAALGRLLRVDPYSKQPISEGREDFCQHCIHTLRTSDRLRIQREAMEGRIEFPTPTLARGLKQLEKEPLVFARWEDRN